MSLAPLLKLLGRFSSPPPFENLSFPANHLRESPGWKPLPKW
jgi:hypothetical protein